MTQQPSELQDYLTEAEAIVTEWYSLDGMEESHARSIERIATLICLGAVMNDAPTFADMTTTVCIYLTAAFQMGRAGGNDDNTRVSE
jgi:hypothetical protein